MPDSIQARGHPAFVAGVERPTTYDGPFTVGKDILELLSSSMYVNPLAIYREYVQNAVDAIAIGMNNLMESKSLKNFSQKCAN